MRRLNPRPSRSGSSTPRRTAASPTRSAPSGRSSTADGMVSVRSPSATVAARPSRQTAAAVYAVPMSMPSVYELTDAPFCTMHCDATDRNALALGLRGGLVRRSPSVKTTQLGTPFAPSRNAAESALLLSCTPSAPAPWSAATRVSAAPAFAVSSCGKLPHRTYQPCGSNGAPAGRGRPSASARASPSGSPRRAAPRRTSPRRTHPARRRRPRAPGSSAPPRSAPPTGTTSGPGRRRPRSTCPRPPASTPGSRTPVAYGLAQPHHPDPARHRLQRLDLDGRWACPSRSATAPPCPRSHR